MMAILTQVGRVLRLRGRYHRLLPLDVTIPPTHVPSNTRVVQEPPSETNEARGTEQGGWPHYV